MKKTGALKRREKGFALFKRKIIFFVPKNPKNGIGLWVGVGLVLRRRSWIFWSFSSFQT